MFAVKNPFSFCIINRLPRRSLFNLAGHPWPYINHNIVCIVNYNIVPNCLKAELTSAAVTPLALYSYRPITHPDHVVGGEIRLPGANLPRGGPRGLCAADGDSSNMKPI